MHILLAALLLSAGGRPTVAVVPPAPQNGAPAWVGMSVADNLTTRLLIHSRFDTTTLQRIYPLNVFGWRQTLAAARAEGLDATKALSAGDVGKLQRQLGAGIIFVGSYETKGDELTLRWHLIGGHDDKHRTREANLADLAAGTETLAHELLVALGQSTKGLSSHRLRKLPRSAMQPYGEALSILGRQSLDPRAHLVLPTDEVRRAHALLVEATEATPEFVRGWVERGVASAMLREMERAEVELITAMGHAGEFEPASSLGIYYLYSRQEKTQAAIKVLAEATNTHFGFLHGLGYLGQAYSRAAMGHEALQAFSAYAARVPKNPWARVKRGAMLARLGKHDIAIKEVETLAEEFPDSTMVRIARVSRLIDAKKLPLARKAAEAALRASPNHPALLTRLSYIELELNRTKEALDLARRAVAALGDGRGETLAGYAHLNLAHALARLGKTEEALAVLVEAKRLGVDADDLLVLERDPKVREFLRDARNPFGAR